MGFFSILFKVCLFPDSYFRVLDQRIYKALIHFLLFSLLLTLLLTLLHGSALHKEILHGCRGVMEQTGDLILSPEKGLQTARDPGKIKRYLLNPQLSVDFYPGNSLKKDALDKVQTPYGLIFMDKGILFWAENYGNMGKGRFLTAPMLFSLNETHRNKIQLDRSAVQTTEFLRRYFILAPGEKLQIPSGRFSAEAISGQLSMMGAVMIFVMIFFTVIFSGLSTVLLYSLAQYLWWNNSPCGRLCYKQIFSVLVYCSFAPLITGGLFSLLPEFFLAPQTVFLIAFFIYSLIVFRKIRKYLSDQGTGLPPEEYR